MDAKRTVDWIRARRSDRTYTDRPIEEEKKRAFKSVLGEQAGPFGTPARLALAELDGMSAANPNK